MPVSIQQAQAKLLQSGELEGIGEDVNLFDVIVDNMLSQYGQLFLLNLGKSANKHNVVASGKLLSESYYRVVDDDTLQLWLPDYFDYPNQGVKGVKSSANAPNSPYKFKNYGMSKEGRESIKRYIEAGHAKIDVVKKSKDKALGIGRESKHLKLSDVQANKLIFLIKRQGIKQTKYFDEAISATFDDFEQKMSEAIGANIAFTLEKLNRK